MSTPTEETETVMVRRFYNIPSLTTLAVFEAAARHCSHKNAARELNITPSAVSHQIKALERELGVALFERIHRGVELTREGEELYLVLSGAFQQMADALENLRAAGREPAVTVGATTAVAALWLMPQIGTFWREHPTVRIKHLISDDESDLKRSEVHLMVRYGQGTWPEQASIKIFDDEIIPVCGPAFARQHARTTVEALLSLPLIQLDAVPAEWTTWRDWFNVLGIDAPRITGPTFNNYTIALQAAEDGAGVALGWRKLIEPILSRGTLVPLTTARIAAASAFYLTWSRHRQLSPSAALLRDWLASKCAEPQGSGRAGENTIHPAID